MQWRIKVHLSSILECHTSPTTNKEMDCNCCIKWGWHFYKSIQGESDDCHNIWPSNDKQAHLFHWYCLKKPNPKTWDYYAWYTSSQTQRFHFMINCVWSMMKKVNARRQNTILSWEKQLIIIKAMVVYVDLTVRGDVHQQRNTFIT